MNKEKTGKTSEMELIMPSTKKKMLLEIEGLLEENERKYQKLLQLTQQTGYAPYRHACSTCFDRIQTFLQLKRLIESQPSREG